MVAFRTYIVGAIDGNGTLGASKRAVDAFVLFETDHGSLGCILRIRVDNPYLP